MKGRGGQFDPSEKTTFKKPSLIRINCKQFPKISNIAPIKVNDILISGFRVKAGLFSSCFAAQCTPIDNRSKLPVFKYKTKHWVNSFEINEEDIKYLNPNKFHGWKIFQ